MKKLLLLLVLSIALLTSCQREIHEILDPHLITDSTRLTLAETAGGTAIFHIKTNVDWKIAIQPDTVGWLTASVTSGNTDEEVVLTATRNNGNNTVQKATIVISAVSNSLVKPVSITIIQKARNAYGGTDADALYCAVPTSDGGFIAVGETKSGNSDLSGTSNKGQEDVWIIRTNAWNEKVWSKTLGGTGRDGSHYITTTADGNFLLAASGSTDGDFAGTTGNMLVKIDGNGNVIWQKGVPLAVAGVIPVAGGYILGGTAGNVTNYDYSVVKTDENFTVLWQKTYGGAFTEQASGIVASSDNGFVLGGSTSSTGGAASGGLGYYDFLAIKVDQNGNLLWQKRYGGTADDNCYAIAKTTDGGYVLAGSTESNDGDVVYKYPNSYPGDPGNDGWIVKIDANGNKLWVKTLGGTGSDEFEHIIPIQGGGFLAGGYTWSNDGSVTTGRKGIGDAWVVKLADNGDQLWSKTPGGSDEEHAYYLLETTAKNYVLIGDTYSNDGNVVGWNGDEDGWIFRFTN